jgi:hypothetical protein
MLPNRSLQPRRRVQPRQELEVNRDPPPIVPTSNMQPKNNFFGSGNIQDGTARVNNFQPDPTNNGAYNPSASGTPIVSQPGGQQTNAGVNGEPVPGYMSQETDQLAEDALRELLGAGPRDTGEDEAYIREMLASTVGKGQADLNARMGAAGFGTSGALGAMSSDFRADAARKAAGEVMGVRQGARDEWLDRVRTGLDGQFRDRGMDMTEAQWEQYMAALNESYKEEKVNPPAGGGPSGPIEALDRAINEGATQAVAGPPRPSEYDSLPRVDTPPEDGEVVYVHGLSGPGSYTVYRTRGKGGAYEYVRVDGE